MSYKIVGKYIKNLNFNIPNPKTFFTLSENISNYKITFDIKSTQIKEKIIEVVTSLNLLPLKDNFEKIDTNIIFSTIIELETNITDKKEIEKIVLIKIPTEVYPTLYQTFVYLFEQAGIKNIQIEKKVDFEKMYNDKKKVST